LGTEKTGHNLLYLSFALVINGVGFFVLGGRETIRLSVKEKNN
jgi:hypothetical protein